MNLFRAFATVGGLTLVSRVLGLAREMAIAALLGSGPVAQAFFVAFRLPNLFRRFFAEGAFNMAFVPLFAKRLEQGGAENGAASARAFAEEAMAGLLTVLIALTVVLQLAMPVAILAIAYGFADDPDTLSLTIAFSRIQFPYLLFISLVALLSGVLNAVGRFAAAAGAPILLNLSMIAALAIGAAMDADETAIGYLLAWGVFAAGALQLAFLARAASRAGFPLRLRRPRWSADMARLVALGAPGAVAGGVTQLNILIGTTIATFFDGAVVWLTLADRLYQLPLGMIGVALGVALLPELSRRAGAGDADGARWSLNRAIEIGMIFTLPATAAFLTMPEDIARLVFERFRFTAEDSAATGAALALFAAGLPAYVLIKALSPPYFANEDTRTPLKFAAVSMVVNTALSVGLAPMLAWHAIPIGTAVAAWVNVVLLWAWLPSQGPYAVDRRLVGRVVGAVVASAAMAAVIWFGREALRASTLADGETAAFSDATITVILVIGGALAYFAAAIATRAVRPRELMSMMRRSSPA